MQRISATWCVTICVTVLPLVLNRLGDAKSHSYMVFYNLCYSVTFGAEQAWSCQESVLHGVLQYVLQCYLWC